MIVADANLIAYLLIPGVQTEVARAVLVRDPDWHAPLLWRSEFNSILLKHIRRGDFDLLVAVELLESGQTLLGGREHQVVTADALRLAVDSKNSAYDCEYVVLAKDLGVTLVTADGKLAEAFPGVAQSPADFAR